MTLEDWVFIDDVVVTNLTREMVVSNVINRSTSVASNLSAIVKTASIEGFMRCTTLFQWPWRCTMHLGVIWIVSFGSVPLLSIIDDWEVIYPRLFAFNFSSNVLILFLNMF